MAEYTGSVEDVNIWVKFNTHIAIIIAGMVPGSPKFLRLDHRFDVDANICLEWIFEDRRVHMRRPWPSDRTDQTPRTIRIESTPPHARDGEFQIPGAGAEMCAVGWALDAQEIWPKIAEKLNAIFDEAAALGPL